MNKVESVDRLKLTALYELGLMREEYEQIVENTKKASNNSRFKDIDWLFDKELYQKRKDRKYAALTVELCALVEQLLKDIYSLFIESEYKKKDEKNNIIIDLKEQLEDYIVVEKDIKLLSDLRNYIVHNIFSLKKARKSEKISDQRKNKELFIFLLNSVEEYINHIEVK